MRAVAFGAAIAAVLGVASVAAESLDDPDAPMVTARYTVAPEIAQDSIPQDAAPNGAPAPVHTPIDDSASVPAHRLAMAPREAAANLDAADSRLTGLATNVRLRKETVAQLIQVSAPLSQIAQDRNLRRGFGEMQAAAAKARLFLFAGDQGGVWTYNFTHDSGGVKAAGWTTERADQLGERRIGLAWQRGRARVAVTGMERKFCQFGAEMKDRVVALTLSFSPGWSSKSDHQSS